ncbi:MAG: PH domain-containing protein [Candidatus Paceibacterota bacterium]|jgi:uncharacterized membrane protein YdbT with pleckstrin-like domain
MQESQLRAAYPLSPRKFWKKLWESSGAIFAVGFIPGAISGVFSVVTGGGFTIPIVIAVLAIFFSGLGYSIYVKVYIKRYYYEDENDFLTIKKGVFAPTEIHVQYLKIQDVFVDQDLVDRIMGLYDVHISSATAASGIEAHIDGVEKAAADGLKQLLLAKIKDSSAPAQRASVPVAEAAQPAKAAPVRFAEEISSDRYGLSGAWWASEIIKTFFGAILTPAESSKGSFADGPDNYFVVYLVLFAVFAAWSFIRLYLWRSHYAYSFGEQYIYLKEGIFSISEKHMSYETVQDVNIRQTLLDRIFGVADLIIENASPAVSYKDRAATRTHGIKIEGLDRDDARRIADELKRVLKETSVLRRGL